MWSARRPPDAAAERHRGRTTLTPTNDIDTDERRQKILQPGRPTIPDRRGAPRRIAQPRVGGGLDGQHQTAHHRRRRDPPSNPTNVNQDVRHTCQP